MHRLVALLAFTMLLISCDNGQKVSDSGPPGRLTFLNGSGTKAAPHYHIQFPLDHAAHLSFDIEWWYLTSNLQDNAGNNYGLQWTLFRFRDPDASNPWVDGQIYMAHASLHSSDDHWFAEKFAGAGLGNAGVNRQPIEYFIDTWSLKSQRADTLFPALLTTDIVTPEGIVRVSLKFDTEKAFVLHGQRGFSKKTQDATHASHYYSQPFLQSQGTIQIDERLLTVSGVAWFDHEWSSQLTSGNTLGWDWFSIHLDDGDKIMLFRMRVDNDHYVTGTFMQATQEHSELLPTDIELRPKEFSVSKQRTFPSAWQLKIPKFDIDVTVKADKTNAFNPSVFSYYEGTTSITGSHTGVGFLELTGY